MNSVSNTTYLGISSGQESHLLLKSNYQVADHLIERMLRARVNSVAGRHNVPYCIGNKALYPLLGLFKGDMAGVPTAMEKTNLQAQLTGQGAVKSKRGLQLRLTRHSTTEPGLPAALVGTPIHREKKPPIGYMDQLREVLKDGLTHEFGYLALRMEVSSEQESGRTCTLYGQLANYSHLAEAQPYTSEEDTASIDYQILPFTQAGAERFVEIIADKLRNDV